MLKRKHYLLIAAAIRRARSRATPDGNENNIDTLANDLAAELKRDNPRFKTDEFLSDCGQQPDEKKARQGGAG